MHWLLDDVRGNPRIASSIIGILGRWHEQEEVRAVYPSLSATLQTHRQEIRFNRGDSFDIPIQVQNDDRCSPSNVSIDKSILKWAAKLGVGLVPGDITRSIENEGATIVKTTYDGEIELTQASNGRAIIHIRKADTWNHPLGNSYLWDLEIIKAVEHLEDQPGTVQVQESSGVIMGIGTDFPSSIGIGDIIHVQDRYVQITKRDSESILNVDFTEWSSEVGLNYNLYRGQTRTVAAGPWRCIGDVAL